MREPWAVRTMPVQHKVHVYPAAGLCMTVNWRYGLSEYAKSERKLRKLVRLCEEWCARENCREQAGLRLAQSLDASPK